MCETLKCHTIKADRGAVFFCKLSQHFLKTLGRISNNFKNQFVLNKYLWNSKNCDSLENFKGLVNF